jgi:hypothetical protein
VIQGVHRGHSGGTSLARDMYVRGRREVVCIGGECVHSELAGRVSVGRCPTHGGADAVEPLVLAYEDVD